MDELVNCPRCINWKSGCFLCDSDPGGKVPTALSVEYVLLGYTTETRPSVIGDLRERHGLRRAL